MGSYRRLLRPRTETVVQDAGLLRRACGFLADLLIIDIIITAPFTPVLRGLAARAQASGFADVIYSGRELAAIVAVFLVAYLYFVLFEYVLGQTPGMMLVGTRTSGSLGQHLVRNSFLLPFFPFVAFWLIEPAAIGFWRRGVLERISGTRTVHERTILW